MVNEKFVRLNRAVFTEAVPTASNLTPLRRSWDRCR
jgi:hypothetical protein